jgi:predicted Holliday junction resolvase-like endonuclease
MEMMESIIAIVVGIFIGILFAFFYFRAKVESMARRLGEEIGQRVFDQRKAELGKVFEEKYRALLEQWRIETEKAFREDALAKSRAVLKGALAEQLAPIFKVFGYNPSDARFIGDPVDYVIFDGYTKVRERIEDVPITVVLADVKTGEADLTYEQRRIKQGIEKGLIKFEVIRL